MDHGRYQGVALNRGETQVAPVLDEIDRAGVPSAIPPTKSLQNPVRRILCRPRVAVRDQGSVCRSHPPHPGFRCRSRVGRCSLLAATALVGQAVRCWLQGHTGTTPHRQSCYRRGCHRSSSSGPPGRNTPDRWADQSIAPDSDSEPTPVNCRCTVANLMVAARGRVPSTVLERTGGVRRRYQRAREGPKYLRLRLRLRLRIRLGGKPPCRW